MFLSVFLAKVVGCYLFFIGLAVLTHLQQFKKTIQDFAGSPVLVTYSGLLSFAMGLLIAVSHNVWVSDWPTLISIFGWYLVITGLLRIFFPESFGRMTKDFAAKNGLTVWSWLWLLAGAYLMWVGFDGF